MKSFKDSLSISKITHDVRSRFAQVNPSIPDDVRNIYVYLQEEKNIVDSLRITAYERSQAGKQLAAWGKSEGEDLEDVTDKLRVLLEKLGEVERELADKYVQFRATMKSIRTREAALQEPRAKRRDLAQRISNLQKSNPKSPKLREFTQELASLDRDTLEQETELADFKRFALREAFYVQFNALHESSEKTAIIAGFGKYIVDQVDCTPTTPGQPRNPYIGASQTATVLQDAIEAVDSWKIPEVDLRPTLTRSKLHPVFASGHDNKSDDNLVSPVQESVDAPHNINQVLDNAPSQHVENPELSPRTRLAKLWGDEDVEVLPDSASNIPPPKPPRPAQAADTTTQASDSKSTSISPPPLPRRDVSTGDLAIHAAPPTTVTPTNTNSENNVPPSGNTIPSSAANSDTAPSAPPAYEAISSSNPTEATSIPPAQPSVTNTNTTTSPALTSATAPIIAPQRPAPGAPQQTPASLPNSPQLNVGSAYDPSVRRAPSKIEHDPRYGGDITSESIKEETNPNIVPGAVQYYSPSASPAMTYPQLYQAMQQPGAPQPRPYDEFQQRFFQSANTYDGVQPSVGGFRVPPPLSPEEEERIRARKAALREENRTATK